MGKDWFKRVNNEYRRGEKKEIPFETEIELWMKAFKSI